MTTQGVKKGFSLIELLVVIMIIGVLAVIGLSSYRSATRNARNARRAADMEQVRSALEMYRTDVGWYPASTSTTASYDQFTAMVGVLTGYIDPNIQDPTNTPPYQYRYAAEDTSSSPQGYTLQYTEQVGSGTSSTITLNEPL